MLQIDVEIPQVDRYTSNRTIDKIGTAYNRAFREKCQLRQGKPIDVERLSDELDLSIIWEEITEPAGEGILASSHDDPEQGLVITVNELHSDLFKSRPDVYAAAIGHEIGHCVLCHIQYLSVQPDQLALLALGQPKSAIRLHKSNSGWYGLTRDEIEERKARERVAVNKLLKIAHCNDEARSMLIELDSRNEPDWMFWQAEHFARCLLIPSDLLDEALEEGWSLHSWSDIYALGRLFGVSGSMMSKRLEKRGIIEIVDGKLRPGIQPHQTSLFD
jgi:hypothetical protein